MNAKEALKAHMGKGMSTAHPDAAVKKMRAGGKTNSDMLKMGRNLSKVANQKAPTRTVRGTGI
jgi:hypothetical protein